MKEDESLKISPWAYVAIAATIGQVGLGIYEFKREQMGPEQTMVHKGCSKLTPLQKFAVASICAGYVGVISVRVLMLNDIYSVDDLKKPVRNTRSGSGNPPRAQGNLQDEDIK